MSENTQLTQPMVEAIADSQHLDVILVAPGRWLAYNWHGELVGEFYAIPQYEGSKL